MPECYKELMHVLVTHCPSLKQLDLSGIAMGEDSMKTILQALPQLHELTVLEVYQWNVPTPKMWYRAFAKTMFTSACLDIKCNAYYINKTLQRARKLAPDVRRFLAFLAASECAKRGNALAALGSHDGDKRVRRLVFEFLVDA